MYEIGSYVYLRKGAPIVDKDTLQIIHAAPPDQWQPPVSILGPMEIHNAQPYVPITNPFGANVSDPANPYATSGEPTTVLVHTDSIRDPSEVMKTMLPAVAGGGFKVDAFTGQITKATIANAVSKSTWIALGLVAGLTTLMVLRNPHHKMEILTAGAALGAGALYLNTKKWTP